jgi:ribonuclease HII
MYKFFATFVGMGNLLSFFRENQLEAGCDEAGRGCLAGPVVAAAVILPPAFDHPYLNDSKKLSYRQRETLRPIIEKEAISFAVSFIEPEEIDNINILNASILAMHRSIVQLNPQPESLIIDGNRFHTFHGIPHTCMIKGDGRFKSIAAASVLAKTYRDEYMQQLHQKHPAYHWNQNKGYPTREHRKAILKHGSTDQHRKSFKLLSEQQLALFSD